MNSPQGFVREVPDLHVAVENAMNSKAALGDCASYGGIIDKRAPVDIPLLGISSDFQAQSGVHRGEMNNFARGTGIVYNSDEELVCQRCNELVLLKKFCSERYFGLLRNCDHVFCIRCIKYMWTSEKVPNHPGGLVWRLCCCVCNVYSLNSAASQRWLRTIEEKESFFRQYMFQTANMPCPVCFGGEGTCIHGRMYEATYRAYSTRNYDSFSGKGGM